MINRLRMAGTVLAVLASSSAYAQPPAGQPGGRTAAPVRRASATRAADAPTIDGVLDEAVWQRAAPIDTFVQIEPAEGQPATERTEVRILYTPTMIYVGVTC